LTQQDYRQLPESRYRISFKLFATDIVDKVGFSMRREADLSNLFDRLANRHLRVMQGGCYTLDQASEAHRAFETRQTSGKVVVIR
jgi:NADPH:quinone reductase-like Zn-dependent oxidoreductase